MITIGLPCIFHAFPRGNVGLWMPCAQLPAKRKLQQIMDGGTLYCTLATPFFSIRQGRTVRGYASYVHATSLTRCRCLEHIFVTLPNTINMISSGWLGPEELAHHTSLVRLRQDVITAAKGMALPDANGPGKLSLLGNLDRQIQGHLTAMRGHIRDLELLAEEQDM